MISGFATERDVVVEIEEVETSGDVDARRGEFGEFLGVVVASLEGSGGAFSLKLRPIGDLPFGGLVFGIGGDPREEFAVTFSCGDFFEQGVGADFHEGEETFIEARVIDVGALFSREGGPAFVENARQDDIAPETNVGRTGRARR